ncbi:MAG TPA: TetR/AcrR family transcriptional regulator, partial [Microbacterium sp.]|nr:TetR/AcrR family transcriptional regulator [Microbacterium sp.]
MARTRASDFEAKQHGILMGAAAVFAEQGMEKASMAQIASHCNVSKALLYHYYPSKDDLIFAIIHTHLIEVEASVAAAVDPTLPAEAQLRRLVGVVLDTYRGADDAHRVQLIGTAALTEEQRAEIRGVERQIVRHFSAVLSRINPELDRPGRPLLMPVTMS